MTKKVFNQEFPFFFIDNIKKSSCSQEMSFSYTIKNSCNLNFYKKSNIFFNITIFFKYIVIIIIFSSS